MSDPRADLLTRLGRPLRLVIGLVAATGVMAALLVDADPPAVDAARAGVPGVATTAAPGAPVDPAAPTGPAPTEPAPGAGATPAGDPATAPPGPVLSAVPTPGVYRYRVESTRDGATTVETEEREITQLSGDRAQGTVQVVVRSGEERQVSVIDWAPSGALVRSTRIETGSAAGQDCAWQPPFPEFGPLAEGSSWELSSTCRTEVGGIPTTFQVAGGGRVAGSATVAAPGGDVTAWRIERTRTTTISAEVGGDALVQRVEERSTVFLDPARSVVVRSESVIVTDGPQAGRVERVSVLQA